MGENSFDYKELPGCRHPIVFACYAGVEKSRIAAQLLRDAGCDAETFPGGMYRMKKLTAEKILEEFPYGADFILIYDHVVGKGGGPSEQHKAIDACEKLLREAKINYREMDTTQLKIFLSNAGVQNASWQFSNQVA